MSARPRIGTIGQALWRGENGYESARRNAVWNARTPDRFPEVIVTALAEEDVVASVRFARAEGLRVAVRAGGHNWFGAPLRDGGLLIDLSKLTALSVDAAARTAALQPAVTSREFASSLAADDLAFPVGHCPTVALSGYLLGGGLGWNVGLWGPACFSLRAVEVVRADGELVTADEGQNVELFWLARGAGAGFPGVVTRYHVSLQPLPSAITASTFVYPIDALGEIAPWAAETAAANEPWVEQLLLLASSPAGEGHVVVLNATAFAGAAEEAIEALAPLETCPARPRALIAQANQSTTFDRLFDELGAHFPEGHRCAVDVMWSNAEFPELLDRVRAHVTRAPSAKSFVYAVPLAPPPAEAPRVDAAFSMFGRVFLACNAVWENDADDAANLEWFRRTVDSVEPLASGFYVAETDLTAGPERAPRSFAEQHWRRIEDLRGALDPDGLFHGYPGRD